MGPRHVLLGRPLATLVGMRQILTRQMFEEYHGGRLFMHSVGGAVAWSDNALPVNHEISTLFV